MGYSDVDIRRVLDATDFVAIVSDVVALKKIGRQFVGLCPFHSEDSPSFSVNGEEGLYYCFGCHAKGNAITFVREIYKLDFVEALEMLARRAGISIEPIQDVNGRSRDDRQKLLVAYSRLSSWYRENLLDPVKGKSARNYLEDRGIGLEAQRHFELGFCPVAAQTPLALLGLSAAEWESGGLGYRDAAGRIVDHMKGRVVFPIKDLSGKVVAFGGRILPQEEERSAFKQPKYKNSSDSPIYHKRSTLYNLSDARDAISKQGFVLVCEGYTDVIALWQLGIANVVATCGTAFSGEHMERLRRFSSDIVLMFDGDKAGQGAMERLWGLEERFGVRLFVARLAGGMDPAEAAAVSPSAITSAVEQRIPITRYVLDLVLASGSAYDAESRAETADKALAVLAKHPNHLIRSEYLAVVADRLGYSVSQLAQRMPRAGGETKNSRRAPAPARDLPAEEALRLLVHDPGNLSGVIVEALFNDPLHRRLVDVIGNSVDMREAEERVLAAKDEGLERLFYRLANEPSENDPLDVLTTLVVRESRRQLDQMIKCATRERADLDVAKLAEEISKVRLQIESLQSDRRDGDTCGMLIGWLIEKRTDDTGKMADMVD
jgi:DNA primase